jgi:hypothetical protein
VIKQNAEAQEIKKIRQITESLHCVKNEKQLEEITVTVNV